MRKVLVALGFCLSVSPAAFGAVFVVPDDTELVHKSNAIVTGRVESAQARTTPDGVETVYRVRVDRTIKGLAGGTIDVVSPGGVAGGQFTAVQGSAHFTAGDEVLLFLVQHRGNWTPTDMTLGKFRFVTSTGGQSLLVRDEEDIVGFDRKFQPHVERVRRQAEFLRFVSDVVRGRGVAADTYFVDPKETVALEPEKPRGFDVSADSSHHTSASYAIHFNGTYPGRWPSSRMSATLARPYYKNASQNASGFADGGVALATSSLSAWANDCPSAVNVVYGGTVANLKDSNDGVNVFVYNDPGGHIAGSWTGSGVIATAYMSGGNFHSFDGRTDWVGLTDSDVVVQNGLTGAEPFMATALTHEVGHSIGLRHANTHFDGSACTAADECTSSAIMNSYVVNSYQFTLQGWDMTAIRKIYPATCTTAAATRFDHDGDGKADILWRHAVNGLNYMYKMNANVHTGLYVQTEPDSNWKMVAVADFDGDTKSDILWRHNVSGINYMYKMDGNVQTGLWVNVEPNTAWKVAAVGDFNGDGKADIYWRNSTTAQSWMYLMNGNVISASVYTQTEPDLNWKIVAVGDFNGDGKDDLFWRHSVSGLNWIYQMDGANVTGVFVQTEPDPNWKVVGAGDFDGDGKDDILWRNAVSGINYIYKMNGGSVTGLWLNVEPNLNWKIANVADFNGDGKADILWRNSSTGQNWMYLMNSNVITASLYVQTEPDQNWQIQK